MNLNLHGMVRGAITSSNSDIPITYLQSTGNTVSDTGKSTPSYAAPVTIMGQVQPVTGSQIRKYSFLQAQGTYKSVHLYGDIEAIQRVSNSGGDLLQFPIVPGGPVYTWLVSKVDETWNTGWCRVIVTLQLDPNNPP
jgi:hypothetical protein